MNSNIGFLLNYGEDNAHYDFEKDVLDGDGKINHHDLTPEHIDRIIESGKQPHLVAKIVRYRYGSIQDKHVDSLIKYPDYVNYNLAITHVHFDDKHIDHYLDNDYPLTHERLIGYRYGYLKPHHIRKLLQMPHTKQDMIRKLINMGDYAQYEENK